MIVVGDGGFAVVVVELFLILFVEVSAGKREEGVQVRFLFIGCFF